MRWSTYIGYLDLEMDTNMYFIWKQFLLIVQNIYVAYIKLYILHQDDK